MAMLFTDASARKGPDGRRRPGRRESALCTWDEVERGLEREFARARRRRRLHDWLAGLAGFARESPERASEA
jgi:hypothetical protein